MATTSLPNDGTARAGQVRGLAEAKAAFKALPAIVQERMLDATETTVREIARGALARLLASPSIQTRALYNAVAWRVTKSSGRGRVGIANVTTTVTNVATRTTHKVKGLIIQGRSGRQRIDRPARRAHFVEFGTRFRRAEPFMLPSADAEKDNYLQRAVKAGKAIESDAAAIGGGGRFL